MIIMSQARVSQLATDSNEQNLEMLAISINLRNLPWSDSISKIGSIVDKIIAGEVLADNTLIPIINAIVSASYKQESSLPIYDIIMLMLRRNLITSKMLAHHDDYAASDEQLGRHGKNVYQLFQRWRDDDYEFSLMYAVADSTRGMIKIVDDLKNYCIAKLEDAIRIKNCKDVAEWLDVLVSDNKLSPRLLQQSLNCLLQGPLSEEDFPKKIIRVMGYLDACKSAAITVEYKRGLMGFFIDTLAKDAKVEESALILAYLLNDKIPVVAKLKSLFSPKRGWGLNSVFVNPWDILIHNVSEVYQSKKSSYEQQLVRNTPRN